MTGEQLARAKVSDVGSAKSNNNPADSGAKPATQALPAPARASSATVIIEGYEILDDPVLGKGSLARDPKTGLIWQRCSVGQIWNDNTCTGEAKRFNWDDAQKLAGNGWRVPTVRELASLIYCSSGKTKYLHGPKDGGAPIANDCAGDYTSPTIRTAAYPRQPASYASWSSSPYVGYSYYAWHVYFFNGYVSGYYRNGNYYVRLVR